MPTWHKIGQYESITFLAHLSLAQVNYSDLILSTIICKQCLLSQLFINHWRYHHGVTKELLPYISSCTCQVNEIHVNSFSKMAVIKLLNVSLLSFAIFGLYFILVTHPVISVPLQMLLYFVCIAY